MVSENSYDAVLMDIQMPAMDGYKATAEIRKDERFSDLPILGMTASAIESDRERCLEAGMNDHIAKPIDPDGLFMTLLEWISAREREPVEAPTHEDGSQLEVPSEHSPVSVSSGTNTVDALSAIDGLDAESGLKRVVGKRDFYEKLVRGFVEGDESKSVSTIRDLLAMETRRLQNASPIRSRVLPALWEQGSSNHELRDSRPHSEKDTSGNRLMTICHPSNRNSIASSPQ